MINHQLSYECFQEATTRLVTRLNLQFQPLLLDDDVVGSATLLAAEGRRFVITCYHVWEQGRERLQFRQREQPAKRLLLSDEKNDIVVLEIVSQSPLWYRDANTLMDYACEFIAVDIDALKALDIKRRMMIGIGSPTNELNHVERICYISSYFGKEAIPPEFVSVRESLFYVTGTVSNNDLGQQSADKQLALRNFQGMSGGPVYRRDSLEQATFCGIQCGQFDPVRTEEGIVIWEAVVRPDILAECLATCLR